MEAVAETKYSLPLRSCVSLPMRRPLLAGLALAVCVATPLAAAQPRAQRACTNPHVNEPYCYGYLFVGDGRRRTGIVVDGVPVGRAPVLLLLDYQRRHVVGLGPLRLVVRVQPRELVELELDRATARARNAATPAALAVMRTRAPLGYASEISVDRCGGIWSVAPLHRYGVVDEELARQLWGFLTEAQVSRVVPRPEEVAAYPEAWRAVE